MELKAKKMAAAMAAVSAHMQMEQEALSQATAHSESAQRALLLNHWGQSGRQAMMTMRQLMQLRAINRL